MKYTCSHCGSKVEQNDRANCLDCISKQGRVIIFHLHNEADIEDESYRRLKLSSLENLLDIIDEHEYVLIQKSPITRIKVDKTQVIENNYTIYINEQYKKPAQC